MEMFWVICLLAVLIAGPAILDYVEFIWREPCEINEIPTSFELGRVDMDTYELVIIYTEIKT